MFQQKYKNKGVNDYKAQKHIYNMARKDPKRLAVLFKTWKHFCPLEIADTP